MTPLMLIWVGTAGLLVTRRKPTLVAPGADGVDGVDPGDGGERAPADHGGVLAGRRVVAHQRAEADLVGAGGEVGPEAPVVTGGPVDADGPRPPPVRWRPAGSPAG